MLELPDTQYLSRHAGIDTETFDRVARDHMNAHVSGPGHHPHLEYSPLAWRHYVRRLAVLDRLSSIEFSSALDVGCAEGYLMASIAKARGAEVWGVDLSDRAVAVAASRYGSPVAAAQGNALPFADGAFDLVYSTEVLEHVLDPAAMVAEMRRVSRGHVLVTTPVSQSDHEHEPDYQIRLQGHVNDFDEASVRRLFGPQADVQSFRCNTTAALLTAGGRGLPSPLRDAFYLLDQRVAKRFGSPHGRFVPLRNRDWIIVTEGAARKAGRREWYCPICRGELTPDMNTLRCLRDGVSFSFVAPGVPDFLVTAT